MTRTCTTNKDFPAPDAGTDPLRHYEHVVAGGYFFIPPARTARKPWTWLLPDALGA